MNELAEPYRINAVSAQVSLRVIILIAINLCLHSLIGFEAQPAKSLPIPESSIGQYYQARNCSTKESSQAMLRNMNGVDFIR